MLRQMDTFIVSVCNLTVSWFLLLFYEILLQFPMCNKLNNMKDINFITLWFYRQYPDVTQYITLHTFLDIQYDS